MNSFNDMNNKMKQTLNRTSDFVGLNLLTSVVVTTILEILLRRSFLLGILFIKENPLLYLLNLWIIFTTLNVILIFKNKIRYYRIIILFWCVIGIINFIIMSARRTPFSFMDAYEITSDIIHKGYGLYVIAFMIIVMALIIIFSCRMKVYKKRKQNNVTESITLMQDEEEQAKETVKYYGNKGRLYGIVVFLVSCGVLLCIYNTSKNTNVLSSDFGNLRNAYLDYGFTYCFSNSVVNHGISKPKNYSEVTVNKLLQDIEEGINNTSLENENNTWNANNPNIIMVQLESFFDVMSLEGINISENPLPNFTELKEDYPSGNLRVPSFGAGTANTEFEVITSMHLDHFGVGEYPYRTILQFEPVESAPYVLSEQGYTTYAIHNNNGSFYKRNTVFSRLGFDYFIPIESMENVEYNPTGWAKDKVLIEQIKDSLENSVGSDFIYTISVQAHNEYPTTKQDNMRIKVSKDYDYESYVLDSDNESTSNTSTPDNKTILTDSFINQMEYYVNQLQETDQFVGQLVDELSSYKEPTVVVFYGDHLPPMELDTLLTTDKYNTEYVIWNNFKVNNNEVNHVDLNHENKEIYSNEENMDLATYQLIPYVMELCNMHYGNIIQYHQAASYGLDVTTPIYQQYESNLKLLQYDLLYGKSYATSGKKLYIQKQMNIGLE